MNFTCPSCGDEEHPDEVGIIKCDCGAVIETYDNTGGDDRVVVVSEAEWPALEEALLTGAPHPLDEQLRGRRVEVSPTARGEEHDG